MTQAQLIAAILGHAKDVVKHYWADLTHDARLIADAKPGSTFVWAPRESGTFVVLLQREGQPNTEANHLFGLFSKSSDAPKQWYYLSVGQAGECRVDAIPQEEAALAAAEATKRAFCNKANAVSEIHM